MARGWQGLRCVRFVGGLGRGLDEAEARAETASHELLVSNPRFC